MVGPEVHVSEHSCWMTWSSGTICDSARTRKKKLKKYLMRLVYRRLARSVVENQYEKANRSNQMQRSFLGEDTQSQAAENANVTAGLSFADCVNCWCSTRGRKVSTVYFEFLTTFGTCRST